MRPLSTPARRRTNLTTQLVASHLLVIAIATGLSTFGLLSLARQYFVNADRQSLLVQARLLARSCDAQCLERRSSDADLSTADLPAAANAVQSQVDNRNRTLNAGSVPAVLADPSGVGLSDGGSRNVRAALTSQVRVVKRGDPSTEQSVADALAGRESTRQLLDKLVAAAPVRQAGAVMGAIVVSQPASDSRSIINDLRRRGLVAGILAAVVAMFVAFVRAQTITRPVKRLSNAAHAIAGGDFASSLPSGRQRGPAEIADLSASFATMSAQVQHQLEVRTEFLANASHELRTPLTAIKGYVELLVDGAAEKPEVRDRFLASMDRETDRLIRLVDALLTLSRSDGGALALQRRTVMWGPFVENIVNDLQPMATTLGVALHFDEPQASAASLSGDPDRITQILVNVVSNALAHTQSYVHVDLSASDTYVTATVIDDGPGIAIADRERVFDRFVRLDESRARPADHGGARGGAGLGLAISRSLAEAHGGTLSVEPLPGTNQGGARFVLRLPR